MLRARLLRARLLRARLLRARLLGGAGRHSRITSGTSGARVRRYEI